MKSLKPVLLLFTFLCLIQIAKAQFCYPTFTNGCVTGSFIDSVYIPGNLSLINNTSNCTGSNPNFNTTYYDTVCWVQGIAYPLYIRTTDSNLWVKVFLDYNGNQNFSDIGEEILSLPTNSFLATGTVQIPTTATTGVHRLRVMVYDSTFQVPLCDTLNKGEIEEYFVNIIPASPGPLTNCGCVSGSSINLSGCDSLISPSSNQVWYTSGFYNDTVVNSNSCDSIIYANVSITTINDSIYNNNGTLFAFQNNVQYQWIYCTNQTILTNDTLQSYSPLISGDYACIISDSHCTDTTQCLTVLSTNSTELVKNNNIKIYPNPLDNILRIELPDNNYSKIWLLNAQGHVLIKKDFLRSDTILDLQNLPSGFYILKCVNTTFSQTYKIIKR